MKPRGLNSLFGRLAALVIVVLLLPHFVWYALVKVERSEMRSRYAVEETRFLIEAVEQHVASGSTEPLPWRLRTVPLGGPGVPDSHTPIVPGLSAFIAELQERLPAGTQIRMPADAGKARDPVMWVLLPGQLNWIVMAVRPLPPPRPQGDRMVIWLISSFSAAVLFALFAAWRLQHPIRKLATAAARFGRGRDVPPVVEEGPQEFRLLTRRFNQMVADISRNESDRGIMLAGVAHDLKAPLSRLRLRAEMVDDEKQRNGFVRDVDSLTHIVDQFLVFAHDGADQSLLQSVNAHCIRYARNFQSAWPERAPLRLELHAPDDCKLSAATLDRLLSNLIDNAYHYGAPPVTISTGGVSEAAPAGTRWTRNAEERETASGGAINDGWFVAVSDEGGGIPEAELGSASRPFVRLDPARGGNAHCGLGLAIVERLAQRAGGRCILSNGPSGGLRVELRFRTAPPSA
ncbi:MAG: ATP-binding protein [Janthinobacterium lividum]